MLDAYYQCFRQGLALHEVIKRYRSIYSSKTTKLVLASDGGDDFSKLAAQYECEWHSYERSVNNKNLIFSGPAGIFRYVDRMGDHCKTFTNEFFILLEDDVIILKAVDNSTLHHSINGCNKNEFLDPVIGKELKRHNPGLSSCSKIWYGACGGSIFRTEFMVDLLQDKDRLRREAEWYCSKSKKEKWASDCFLSYLCLKSGGTIGQYPGYCETWYPDYGDRVVEGSVEVLHQYKRLYR